MSDLNNNQLLSSTDEVHNGNKILAELKDLGISTKGPDDMKEWERKTRIEKFPHAYIADALGLIVKAINSNTAQLAKIEQLLKDQQK